MSDTTTISLRLPTSLIERIDAAAAQQGQNRTAYIVSWLPEAHSSGTETHQQQANGNDR